MKKGAEIWTKNFLRSDISDHCKTYTPEDMSFLELQNI